MDSEVGVAIIGAGYWGSKLIKEYLALSKEYNVDLKAVVDVSRDKLEKVHKENGIPKGKLYTDYKKILENSDIIAVHIATPNETHFTLAKDFLSHGKHVLLEKPMALNSTNAFKLTRLAEVNGSVLLVGHIFRFNNALHKVKEILSKNFLGEIYYLDLAWTTKMVPPVKRDIIFDLAPHPIDILNFLTDEWPKEVYVKARSYIRRKEGLEEFAYALLEMNKGVLVHVKLSWLEYGKKRRIVKIVGEKGVLEVDALSQKIIYIDNKNNENLLPIKPNNTIRDMIKHFIDVIRGHKPPSNSALIGTLTVVVLEAMRKSLEEDIPVPILR